MAADVSSLVRIMSEYKKDAGDDKSKRNLVTRDFLGCAVIGSKELDLDLKIPSGWERRLDLLSGETYLEKSGSKSNSVHRELHDLNLPPPPVDNSTLDLGLLLPSAPPSHYQSVCTLEKVRSALERAGRESHNRSNQIYQQRSDGSASPSSSTTSSSMKRRAAGDQEVEKGTDGSDSPVSLIAAGCPSCLLYVLISRDNPRCPRCDSHVPSPAPALVISKKPRIDLNSL